MIFFFYVKKSIQFGFFWFSFLVILTKKIERRDVDKKQTVLQEFIILLNRAAMEKEPQ